MPKSPIHPKVPPTVSQVLKLKPTEQNLTIAGWIRTCRHSKAASFLAIGDGSCSQTVQVVIPLDLPGRDDVLGQLSTGASVRIEGVWIASQGAQQAAELMARTVHVIGSASQDSYPLQKKGHTLAFLRSIPSLRPRTNTLGAVMRIRSTLAQATHDFFRAHGFAYVHTPIITTSDCEGAGDMFEVVTRNQAKDGPFFGRPAFLTVSGQLAGEALAYGLGRIYTFGPTFRAENSNTTRHLSEFWMIEPEMAFFDAAANRQLAQGYLQACLTAVLERHESDLVFLAKHYKKTLIEDLRCIAQEQFVEMTYTEAVERLKGAKHNFEYPVAWGRDLQSEHERYLVETQRGVPVIVTDYPKELKSFYMYQNDDEKTVGAMDVLVAGIGEIIGGSQREHRLDRLEGRMQALGMPLEPYAWYLDLHRYGTVDHAGFGLGFERLVMLATGMENIRDVIAFPRAPQLAPG